MTRLRDEDFVRPSHAAILRQQEAHLAEIAHVVGVAPSVGSHGPHAPEAESERQPQCWLVCDPEEQLRYI